MSVTTTDNARLVTVRHVFADYELHHSQPSSEDAAPAPSPIEHPAPDASPSSDDWEDRWRRVPAYRGVNRQLDDERNTYNNAIERNFIRVMFGGVSLMATASSWWRGTGGKINSDFFQYKIGGEW